MASGGKAKWSSFPGGLSYDIATGMKDVVLGELPQDVTLSNRVTDAVLDIRAELDAFADVNRLVLQRTPKCDWRWWTWGGMKVNRTLMAWLPTWVDPTQRLNETWLRLHGELTIDQITDDLEKARTSVDPRPLPAVDAEALRGLKFSEALPKDLAVGTLASRMIDRRAPLTRSRRHCC